MAKEKEGGKILKKFYLKFVHTALEVTKLFAMR